MANTKRNPTRGKPISSHPLFPAVVALWFGALFGLGSLAIRPTLIESVVLKTGVDLVVPAAAPPLGVTARILIALVMASLGAAIGAALALRASRPKVEVRERKRSAANPGAAAEAEAAMWNQRDVFTDGPVRRPLSAHEDLGEVLDGPNVLIGRRRPLAVEHEDRPFEPHDVAPLPGGEPQIFDISATRLAPVSHDEPAEAELAPLDLGIFPAPAPVEVRAPFVAPQASAEPGPSPMIEREVPVVPEIPRIFGMPAEDGHVPVDFVRAAGFRTSVFETEQAEPLFADRPEAYEQTFAATQPVEPATTAPAPQPQAVAEPQPGPADLGMTDLAKRLQESMARRRAAKAQADEAVLAPVVAPEATSAPVEPSLAPPTDFDLAADQAVAAVEITPAPIPMPAVLRPLSFDQPDDEDHADLSVLMPRHLAMPAPAPAEPAPIGEAVVEEIVAAAEPETEQDEDAFASLLSIEMPRQEFVRVEEPEETSLTVEPVVIFPGQMASAAVAPLRPFDAPSAAMPGAPVASSQAQPAVDPAEAERALRLALANLQRISGAA